MSSCSPGSTSAWAATRSVCTAVNTGLLISSTLATAGPLTAAGCSPAAPRAGAAGRPGQHAGGRRPGEEPAGCAEDPPAGRPPSPVPVRGRATAMPSLPSAARRPRRSRRPPASRLRADRRGRLPAPSIGARAAVRPGARGGRGRRAARRSGAGDRSGAIGLVQDDGLPRRAVPAMLEVQRHRLGPRRGGLGARRRVRRRRTRRPPACRSPDRRGRRAQEPSPGPSRMRSPSPCRRGEPPRRPDRSLEMLVRCGQDPRRAQQAHLNGAPAPEALRGRIRCRRRAAPNAAPAAQACPGLLEARPRSSIARWASGHMDPTRAIRRDDDRETEPSAAADGRSGPEAGGTDG